MTDRRQNEMRYHLTMIRDVRKVYDRTKELMETDRDNLEFRVKAFVHIEQILREVLDEFGAWSSANDALGMFENMADR